MVATIEMNDGGVTQVRIKVTAGQHAEAMQLYKMIAPSVSRLNDGIRTLASAKRTKV